MDYIIRIIPQMLEGSIVTAQVFLITIVLSIPLGVLLSYYPAAEGHRTVCMAAARHTAYAAAVLCVLCTACCRHPSG